MTIIQYISINGIQFFVWVLQHTLVDSPCSQQNLEVPCHKLEHFSHIPYFYWFGILIWKMFRPTVRKLCCCDWEQLLQLLVLQPQIKKKIVITKSINLNSESSEQFLKQNNFLTFYWRFQFDLTDWNDLMPIVTNDGCRNLQNKLERHFPF